jgi:hypothetical protein
MYIGLALHHIQAASGDPSAIICHFASRTVREEPGATLRGR